MASLGPEVSRYRRNAALITTEHVLHPLEKQQQIEAIPRLRRKKATAPLEQGWQEVERRAAREAETLIGLLRRSADGLSEALAELAGLKQSELLGKVEAEQLRVNAVTQQLNLASEALAVLDFGEAGSAVEVAERDLLQIGGPLVVALNTLLGKAAVGKALREELELNLDSRRAAKLKLESMRKSGPAQMLEAAAAVHRHQADSFSLAARILSSQTGGTRRAPVSKTSKDGALRVVMPQELETFDDIGGLEDVKQALRDSVGAIMERPDEAARYRVVHNGILFHGPPGTGKTLLSRALAGEYGMRYIRFSPASIASSYIHEAAKNLQKLFELAKKNTPCVLFLDEVDTIAGHRGDQPSADHREVVTQLMNSLEEYRTVPGLIIAAATNDIDQLDSGLREGRFDSKILVPLPDPEARADILRVHLDRRRDAVDWDGIDLEEVARQTSGRNAAALEGFVSVASQLALSDGRAIGQGDLIEALRRREGGDRTKLDEAVGWDDVVLSDEVRDQLQEILTVFVEPDLARRLGVKPPAGVLLYGPPGTGKTTVAKVMASEVQASFYEQSAADLLSKWAGESEQKVARLFTKARANRPSIIFIDEIDGLLQRRDGDSSSPWEQRVVSQFLSELDGLSAGEGVLLVGATNRLDIIDEAIVGRRLTPVEVGLPDRTGRAALLEVLCRGVALAKDVDLASIADQTSGLSGADLKRLRDAAGMKALNRASRSKTARSKAAGRKATEGEVAVSKADFEAALRMQRGRSSLAQV
jgi:SpoVK/Ycf46/Vps4 family AAA+-type ATPase